MKSKKVTKQLSNLIVRSLWKSAKTRRHYKIIFEQWALHRERKLAAIRRFWCKRFNLKLGQRHLVDSNLTALCLKSIFLGTKPIDSFTIKLFRLRNLEGECARAASDGIVPIKYKPSYPSMQKGAFTPNNVPSTSYVQEPITLTIPIYNQLLNTLQISDIKVTPILHDK